MINKVMNVFVGKNILISEFLAFLKLKVLRKVLIKMFSRSAQMISVLDGQSKFQMFTLFSGRHVGLPWRYTNMADLSLGFSVTPFKIDQSKNQNRTIDKI